MALIICAEFVAVGSAATGSFHPLFEGKSWEPRGVVVWSGSGAWVGVVVGRFTREASKTVLTAGAACAVPACRCVVARSAGHTVAPTPVVPRGPIVPTSSMTAITIALYMVLSLPLCALPCH